MGAPIGNQNGVGNEGGRRGAGYEWLQAKIMQELLSHELDFDALEARINSGHFYIGEYILYRAVVKQKDLVLAKLMDKLFGDKQTFRPIQNEPLTEEEKVEFADQIDRAFEQFAEIGYKPKLRLNGTHQSPTRSEGGDVSKPRKAARNRKG